MLDKKSIESSNHILLRVQDDSFANASALYSYILTLHKKVSIYNEKKLEYRFSFLPWYEKCKTVEPSSADVVLEVDGDVLKYYTFFQENDIKINKKMATALYSALLLRYKNFSSCKTDGIVFATASQLIEFGAEYKIARQKIVKSDALSLFRLKAILFKKMLLVSSGTELQLLVNDTDLVASGATLEDAKKIMKELLNLVNVTRVVLIKSDTDMQIIDKIEEKEIEK